VKVGQEIETFAAIVKRMEDRVVRKTFIKNVQNYSTEFMFENEVQALKLVKGIPCFQQLVEAEFPHIYTTYCGVELKETRNIAFDVLTKELNNILQHLSEINLVHRDILPRNILQLNGRLILIDFTWAYFKGSKFRNIDDAPKGLGGRWNPKRGFTNKYSIDIIKKELIKR
jgi:serine/threonine protein kinase